MKTETVFNHELGSLVKALGLTEDRAALLRRQMIEEIHNIPEERMKKSIAIELAIKIGETPEEVAFLAFQSGMAMN